MENKEKAEAKSEPKAEPKPAWFHDADHGADQVRNAAQKARDVAAGYAKE
jgi:hypothetical protein